MRALQAVLRQALWDSPDVQALQLPGLYPALGLLPWAAQYLRSACVGTADAACSWPMQTSGSVAARRTARRRSRFSTPQVR